MAHRIPIFSSFLLAFGLLLQQSLEAKGPPTQVTVTGAEPSEATQGQMIPVIVSGENFDAGSTVRFLVSGTKDDSQIQVGTVGFNPDGTLTADIRVRDDAQVFEYDIEVRTSSGRRGKGTSLFRVKSSSDTNTGGFGELGNGCVTFTDAPDFGTFHDDGGGTYCNGTDGQVSVPLRLRLDTKKFNSEDRAYWLYADCSSGSNTGWPVCDGPIRVGTLQSQLRYELIDGSLVATSELDFQGLVVDEIARVSVDLDLPTWANHKVKFGNDSDPQIRCDAPAASAPVWVACDGDSNHDGFCDLWTLSTVNLGGPDVLPGEGDARACLKNTKRGVVLDGDVTADFTLKVCVLGLSCPLGVQTGG